MSLIAQSRFSWRFISRLPFLLGYEITVGVLYRLPLLRIAAARLEWRSLYRLTLQCGAVRFGVPARFDSSFPVGYFVCVRANHWSFCFSHDFIPQLF
tara:strand:+ start:170 stop:460 length:291 start_codon:yes stop_codon:yes gene_type:complete